MSLQVEQNAGRAQAVSTGLRWPPNYGVRALVARAARAVVLVPSFLRAPRAHILLTRGFKVVKQNAYLCRGIWSPRDLGGNEEFSNSGVAVSGTLPGRSRYLVILGCC